MAKSKRIIEEGFEECRKILADASLTAEAKVEAVKNEVAFFTEKLIEVDSNLPEVRAWRKHEKDVERKYLPKRGETFLCPSCHEYFPEIPADVHAVGLEFQAIRDRKAAELVKKILAGKAA